MEQVKRLLMMDDLFERLKGGAKKGTMRLGYRHVLLGPLEIVATNDGRSFPVIVTEVRHKLLCDLTQAEIEDWGGKTTDDVLHAMRRFYPDVRGGSEVTLIFWGD